MKKIDEQSLVGKKYGDIIVKQFVSRRGKNGLPFYNVKCKYGVEFQLSRRDLNENYQNKPCTHCHGFNCPKHKNEIINNEIGKKYNFLTVISFDHYDYRKGSNRKDLYFKFKCDCGNEKVIKLDKVKYGDTISCGCKKNIGIETHKQSRTRLYHLYYGILQRCYNSNSNFYNNYGGRGITVCKEWSLPHPYGFLNFYNWAINSGYRDDLSIDRIDVNGNYEPSNCRWVNNIIQSYNKRNTFYLYNYNLYEYYNLFVSKEIPFHSFVNRVKNEIYKNWSINDIVNISLNENVKEYRKTYNIINPVYFNGQN